MAIQQNFIPTDSAESYAVTPPRAASPRSNLIVAALLIALFTAAAYFRFVGQNWDDFTHLHPDERFLTQVAEAIGGPLIPTNPAPELRQAQVEECQRRYPATNGVGDFFDSRCSTWYPKNAGYGLYVYGELPLFVVRVSAELTQMLHMEQAKATEDPIDDIVARSWTSYNGIHLVGRSVSAVAEPLSLAVLFLIGLRLYNKWVGVLAVALGAAAVFPIQLAHFWTADAFTNLPVTLAFLFAVNAMKGGRWPNFIGFGLAMGAALASRINTLPLFGVIGLAAIIYALPALDKALARNEKIRLVERAFIGLVLAAVFTGISFRLLNPHAFTGGPGLTGILNIVPYQPFLDDLGQAQYLTSGKADFPPNHQWASRTPYLFPARNMIIWGMGIPLGLMAWFGLGWAIWQIVRSKPGWTRHALIVAWVVVYFAYMGRLWVMTMRYYMPLYPFLILLAAWALYEIVTRAWHALQNNPTAARRMAYVGGVGLLVFTVSFTYLWATAYTSVYRRLLTRVEASYWMQRNVSSGFSANLIDASGQTHLVNIPMPYSLSKPLITTLTPGDQKTLTIALVGNAPQAIDQVRVSRLYDPDRDSRPKAITVAITADPSSPDVLASGTLRGNFGDQDGWLGSDVVIPLDRPVELTRNLVYYLIVTVDGRLTVSRLSDGEAEFALGNAVSSSLGSARFPDVRRAEPLQAQVTVTGSPLGVNFDVPLDGTISQLNLAHVLNPLRDGREFTLNMTIRSNETGAALSTARLRIDASGTRTSQFGDPFAVRLETPLDVVKGQRLRLEIAAEDGAIAEITGTVVATEGPWDDPVPQKVCDLPYTVSIDQPVAPGRFNVATCGGFEMWGTYYKGLELYMSAEDDEQKKSTMQRVLDQTDYITISSNRFYDTLTRLPTRFPMSIAFYKALFSGELGFERVKTVESTFELFGQRFPDQNYPFNGSPAWVNEWESEEAFSVYDHPTVFIFRKNPGVYSSLRTAAILEREPINDQTRVSFLPQDDLVANVIRWGALEATAAPTGLKMTDEMRATQTAGGTWSELFNREWPINSGSLFTVIGWWLTIMAFGLAAWPLVWAILPGLPDRGYPFTKIVGLLIVAWLAYTGGTIGLHVWNSGGLLLLLIGMAAVSAGIVIRQRAAFFAFVRANFNHLLMVEVITAGLFVAFLVARLGNPDLWAQVLGGEKPMNFSYFNAVLKSTIFPAYDPWYAGGYLNYYYFGYVLVGAPVKLIGVMPSIAYNLLIPTLFALTGIGAFALAYNLVAARGRYPREEGRPDRDAPLATRRRYALRTPRGSAYLAGILAIVVCVVLGNLATPKEFLSGVSRAGGCSTLQPDMYLWKVEQFVATNGRQPTPDENTLLLMQADNPTPIDQVGYALYGLTRNVDCLGRGIGAVLSGSVLPIGPDRWYWGPRSVVGELPGNSNEINEFPFFTFIFGDLHAHMIALPITLLAVGWLLAEVLAAGHLRRPTWVVVCATALGGLAVGILRATNTWDWITYLIVGMLGLPFAIYLRREAFTREHVTAWIVQIGGFFVMTLIAAAPFTAFFATSYSAVKPFLGNKTPIWAYLTMHGIFLFAVTSLMVWQTARLFRHTYVRDLIGRGRLFTAALVGVPALILITLFIAFGPTFNVSLISLPIPIGVILIPLLAWAAFLFLLPGQTREWRVVYVLIGVALGISLGVETVVLDGDIGRQNTFFKFYMQVWMLFSIATGVGLAWLIGSVWRWTPSARSSWLFVLAVLLGIGALFPVMSTQGRNAMRMAPEAPRTLDGLDYMNFAIYYEGSKPIPLKDDLAMIRWLQDNVKGSPVILEAHQFPSEYKYNARITINTGLPTVLGWRFHQQQQRTLDPLPNLVVQREGNVTAIYNTLDIGVAWRLLQHFNVEYIIIGELERVTYQADGLAKFDTMVDLKLLEKVYDQNGSKIYRVVPGAVYTPILVGMGR